MVEVDDAGRVEVFRVGNYGTGAKTSISAGAETVMVEIRAIRRKEFYEERVGCTSILPVSARRFGAGSLQGRMLIMGE